MGADTKIEWTDSSWSPIRASSWDNGKFRIGWHCEHVSEGCRNCYAERMNLRLGTGYEFKPGHRESIDIALDEEMLLAPLRWKKPRMIFVCSMTDAFADFVKDEWLDKMFAVMALCPQHTFQVLTKRAERMRAYCSTLTERAVAVAQAGVWLGIWDDPDAVASEICNLLDKPLPNVWLGVSCERQQEADERIPHLLQTPAVIRFVSAEPLLGPIDLRTIYMPSRHAEFPNGEPALANLDWLIAGGESGPSARPMHPDWARSIRDQCDAAGVAFFFKQHGQFVPESCAARDHQGAHTSQTFGKSCVMQDGEIFWSVGKKAAGRLLDGKEHNEFPVIDSSASQSGLPPHESKQNPQAAQS